MTDEQIGKVLNNLPITPIRTYDQMYTIWYFFYNAAGRWEHYGEPHTQGPYPIRAYFSGGGDSPDVNVHHGQGHHWFRARRGPPHAWERLPPDVREKFCDLLHLLITGDI